MQHVDQHTWALVLAAGEGSRLRSLTTTTNGLAVPKQFCSLRGGPSLLHEALQRAENIVSRERICTIVAEQHRAWWREPLAMLDPWNVIVQPENRGTANGILFPLLHILERDTDAKLVLLPSDHHVRDEVVLERALLQSLEELSTRRGNIVLLGISPEEADPELGYIVPHRDGVASNFVQRVAQFVEKPSASEAQCLIERGALWNSFILTVHARTLLEVFESRYPEVTMLMREIVRRDQWGLRGRPSVNELYSFLPEMDFSRGIAQGYESKLMVMRVPKCGWSDLGTPKRVAETLRNSQQCVHFRHSIFQSAGHLNLAEQHAALG